MLLDLFFGEKLATVGARTYRTSELDGVLYNTRASASGATVDDEGALSLSAIFAGVRLMSQIIGMLPLGAYRSQAGGGKEPASTHPAYSVLHTRPNPWMTAKQARQAMEWNRLMGGNAYAEIQWTLGGNVAAYWPLEYWRVQIRWEDDDFYYLVDGQHKVQKDDMLHIPLVTTNGVDGSSFLDYAVESLGLGITAQQAAAYSFANNGRPGGILKHPGDPGPEKRKEFRRGWQEVHNGEDGRNKVGVMWGGWEWQDNAFITPEQMQALESRRFSVTEAARWLGLPPHMLRDLERATFSNVEQQGIDLVTYSVTPVCVDYEQEYDRKLLDPPKLYSKHNVNALLRGDSAARALLFKQLWQIGVYSANDICELEDTNPIGPLGDLRFIPANMQTLERAKEGPAPKPVFGPPGGEDPDRPGPGSDQAGGDNEPADGLGRAWVADIFSRMLRKEANAANRAAARPDKFLSWLDEFYPSHVETIAAALNGVATLMPLGAVSKAKEAAEAHVAKSREELLDLTGKVTPATLAPAVQKLMQEWEYERPLAQAEEFWG